MRLLAGAEGHMVVTHLLEKRVTEQTVTSGDENALALLRLGYIGRKF